MNENLYQGTACGVGSNASLQAVRPSDTESEINMLDTAVNELRAVADMLCGRLNPVMRQELVKSSGDNTGVPENSVAPLAQAIRTNRYSVERTATLLNDVLNRLEV